MKNTITKLSFNEMEKVSGGTGEIIFIGYILTGIGVYLYETYKFYKTKQKTK